MRALASDPHHHRRVRATLVVLLLSISSTAQADQWVTPTARTLASPDHKLQAVITPAADGKSGATAAIGPTQGTAKSFKLADDWMPVDAVLFDDALPQRHLAGDEVAQHSR